MDPAKLTLDGVRIKTEPISPKKVSLPGVSSAHLGIKTNAVSRLPSFKPPRDLSLSGSTTSQSIQNLNSLISSTSKANKKVYLPNINVTRKKGSNGTSSSNDSSLPSDSKSKNKEQAKRPVNSKKKVVNVVQTQGVFSEGLAPGKVKPRTESEKRTSEASILEKPKLNLNHKVIKKNEDNKLKALLRDDFIDDPKQIPDITFIPNSLPVVYNIKNKHESNDIEKTFEYLHMKTEKVINANLKNEASDILSIFEDSDSQKMLLFEFPGTLPDKEESGEKKKSSKGQAAEVDSKPKAKSGSLSNIGEGVWGSLRIHANGKAYFVVGKHIIPVVLTRHQPRQELMSTNIDSTRNKGEVINLGTIDATFTCSTNFFEGVS